MAEEVQESVNYATEETEAGQEVNAQLTNQSDTRSKCIEVKTVSVIPIVFIPGIMGTNLCMEDEEGREKVVWGPPHIPTGWEWLTKTGDLLADALPFIWKSGEVRQREINPDITRVFTRGHIIKGNLKIPKAVLLERGWGEIWSDAYHVFLAKLTEAMNGIIVDYDKRDEDPEKFGGSWQSLLKTNTKHFGGVYGAASEKITPDELKKAAEYRYDIWVIGYNWLRSNGDSGKEALRRIREVILPKYNTEDCENVVEKVIVVSHSMGGFVTRAMSLEEGSQDCILGVSHSVMPATGAPTAYHHMRCGFGPALSASVVLGHNAERVTAVLANAPGGMELLPTMDFNDGKPWLKLQNSVTGQMVSLPSVEGGAYEEIYKSDAWYGLVPSTNEHMLNPANLLTEEEKAQGITPRIKLNDRVDTVEKFHGDFKKKYFDPTIAIAESSSLTSTWSFIRWNMRSSISNEEGIKNLSIKKESGTGGKSNIVFTNGDKASFEQSNGQSGDGTVGAVSGEAPYGQSGVKGYFLHGGNPELKALKDWLPTSQVSSDEIDTKIPAFNNPSAKYAHDESYKSDITFYTSLHNIIKIVQEADWATGVRPPPEKWEEDASSLLENISGILKTIGETVIAVGTIAVAGVTYLATTAMNYINDLITGLEEISPTKGIEEAINPLIQKNEGYLAGLDLSLPGAKKIAEAFSDIQGVVNDVADTDISVSDLINVYKKVSDGIGSLIG